MFHYYRYAGRLQHIRGNFGGLPDWARLVLAIAAVPGTILLALSIVALLVSISVLLLLALPVYSLLRQLTAGTGAASDPLAEMPPTAHAAAKRVEATVLPDLGGRPV